MDSLELSREIDILMETAKIDTCYDDVFTEGVNFGKLLNTVMTLGNTVTKLTFPTTRYYAREADLSGYMSFFKNNKLTVASRVLTYPNIHFDDKLIINSAGIIAYIKEAIQRYSSKGLFIDVEDIRERSIAYCYKSMTGKAPNQKMTRTEFNDSITKYVKGGNATRQFMVIRVETILKLAKYMPAQIAYIDKQALSKQMNIFKRFASNYCKDLDRVAANYESDVEFNKEITKYKQIFENAISDMVYVYRTIRSLYIDMNDEFYKVLKTLKKYYKEAHGMNENNIYLNRKLETIVESAMHLELELQKQDIGIVNEGVIGDAINKIKNALKSWLSSFAKSIESTRSKNRQRNNYVKTMLKLEHKASGMTPFELEAYSCVVEYLTVTTPSESAMDFISAYSNLAQNVATYGDKMRPDFSSSTNNTTPKELDEKMNNALNSVLRSYVAGIKTQKDPESFDIDKELFTRYMGKKMKLIPKFDKLFSGLNHMCSVYEWLDERYFYILYKSYKHSVDEITRKLEAGEIATDEVTTVATFMKRVITFELKCMKAMNDSFNAVSDEYIRVLKEELGTEIDIMVPRLESAETDEDNLPPVDAPDNDIDFVTTGIEPPEGVTMISPMDTIDNQEKEIPDDYDEQQADITATMLAESINLAINGVSPMSVFTESVVLSLNESYQAILEEAIDDVTDLQKSIEDVKNGKDETPKALGKLSKLIDKFRAYSERLSIYGKSKIIKNYIRAFGVIMGISNASSILILSKALLLPVSTTILASIGGLVGGLCSGIVMGSVATNLSARSKIGRADVGGGLITRKYRYKDITAVQSVVDEYKKSIANIEAILASDKKRTLANSTQSLEKMLTMYKARLKELEEAMEKMNQQSTNESAGLDNLCDLTGLC